MADRRRQLLDEAARRCRHKGIAGFSFGDLAEAVAIRKASVHHHFATKTALLAVLLEDAAAAQAQLFGTAAEAPRGADRLRGLIAARRRDLAGGEGVDLLTRMRAEAGSLPEPLLPILHGATEAAFGFLRDAFAAGAADGSIDAVANPPGEAVSALAVLDGAQWLAAAAGDPALFDAAVFTLSRRLAAP